MLCLQEIDANLAIDAGFAGRARAASPHTCLADGGITETPYNRIRRFSIL